MVKDANLVELGYAKYWDERYISEQEIGQDGTQLALGSYEWFCNFETLRPLIGKHVPHPSSGCHILHLGCGNSSLTADLHNLGYLNQTSVDFSRFVIDAMESKYSHLKTQWRVMDLRHMDLPDASVDSAIDKATLDGMIHGSLWDPPEDVKDYVGMYVDEVARVLKPGGVWLYITYRQPHFMKPFLLRESMWSFSVEVLGESQNSGTFEKFAFIMKRHGKSI